ncbi:hypothetical protein C5S39_12260, partial [Candidatus Methanophagaceae archaeon]
ACNAVLFSIDGVSGTDERFTCISRSFDRGELHC